MLSDRELLLEAIELAKKCPFSDTAFAVGAIIFTADGEKFTGYSRELGETDHAEEVAIRKALKAEKTLVDALIYCSLEPCSQRASKPKSCSELLIEYKFKKCVFSELEGTKFVADCRGRENMLSAGIEVIHIPII